MQPFCRFYPLIALSLVNNKMYCLNKFVGVVLNPLAIALLVAMLGFVLIVRNRKRPGICALGLAIVWLWFWSTSIVTWIVGYPLERVFLVDGRVPTVESLPNADAIVLLGGGIGINTNMSAYADMATSADRIWQTARLFKAEKSSTIISTGHSPEISTFQLLKDFGLPEDCVLFYHARNTEEEAKVIAKIGYKKILLVTSAWHMRRARFMFEKYAPEVEVVCAPTDFENTSMVIKPFSLRWFIPEVYILAINTSALHEWIGIVGYKLFR